MINALRDDQLMKDWNTLIFSDEFEFEEKVRKVFEFQFEHNPVYHRYCEALSDKNSCHPELVSGSVRVNQSPLIAFKLR